MNRRTYCASVALATGTAGCLEDAELFRDPHLLGEGSVLVQLEVAEGFTGEVSLDPSCRDDPIVLEGGDMHEIIRRTHGEECDLALYIDDQRELSETVEENESLYVTVSADGTVETDLVIA